MYISPWHKNYRCFPKFYKKNALRYPWFWKACGIRKSGPLAKTFQILHFLGLLATLLKLSSFCRSTHPATKILCSKPLQVQWFFILISINVYQVFLSKPSMYQISLIFWKFTKYPPMVLRFSKYTTTMLLHRRCKTHPVSLSIFIHENIGVPSGISILLAWKTAHQIMKMVFTELCLDVSNYPRRFWLVFMLLLKITKTNSDKSWELIYFFLNFLKIFKIWLP